MLPKIARPFVTFSDRFAPDALVFAVILTIITFILSITVAEKSVVSTVMAWGDSYWKLLNFMTQIAIMLMAGSVLANSPPMMKGIRWVASKIHKASHAYALVCLLSAFAALLSWGASLVIGAVLARETAKTCHERGLVVHYPLLAASAYSGFVLWHQGLSSTIGLKVAEPNHFLAEKIGCAVEYLDRFQCVGERSPFLADKIGVIPLSDILLLNSSVVTLVILLVTLPLLMMYLHPKDEDRCQVYQPVVEYSDEDEVTPQKNMSWTERLSHTYFVNAFVIALGGFYLIYKHIVLGVNMNLNSMNLILIVLGFLLIKSTAAYVQKVSVSGRALGIILIQFPFYAGIMGMMSSAGLTEMISDALTSFATAKTLPFWAFISGGIVNMFVPSGVGQWALQGPVMVEAALSLNADIPATLLGVMMGDQWSNMIQPFWMLPILALLGLKLHQIIGYCAMTFVWSGIVFGGSLLLLT